jgi:hypothetical protein
MIKLQVETGFQTFKYCINNAILETLFQPVIKANHFITRGCTEQHRFVPRSVRGTVILSKFRLCSIHYF